MHLKADLTIDDAIEHASKRLRSVAWAGAVALVAACWGMAYGVSILLMGIAGPAVFFVSVLGGLLMLLVLMDVSVRLHHCQVGKQSGPAWWLRLLSARPFRPLPTHLIEDGELPANGEVESWLASLTQEDSYLRDEAQTYLTPTGHWDRAGAVNLFLLARWYQGGPRVPSPVR